MKNKNQKTGFTLIELILYIALAVVILLAVTEFLSLLLSSRVKNQTISEVEQQGTKVTNLITQEIRNARGIITPTIGKQNNILTLEVQTNPNPTSFFLSDSTIQVTEGTNPSLPLTSSSVKASELKFSNLSQENTKGTIRIQFTLAYSNPSKRYEFNYQKSFYGSATLRSITDFTATQADMLLVDTSNASIGGTGNRDLLGITLKNTGTSDIVIDKITVSWTDTARRIREIVIDGSMVWSRTGPGSPLGDQPSGTELDIQDFILISGSNSHAIDWFRFNGNMRNNTFAIVFTMLDGSQKSVGDIKP